MDYILVKCPQQGQGNNLCGLYVCENIRSLTVEKGKIIEQFRLRKQYSHFYFITIKCAEFHSYILTPLFKLDRTDAG